MAKTQVGFSIESQPSFRDTSGRFAKVDEKILQGHRKGMRVQANGLKKIMQDEAPKKTGDFSRGIKFRTFATGNNGVGFKILTPSPLVNFIVKGTRPHIIRAKNAGALYFFWGKVGAFTVVPKSGGFSTHWREGKLWIGKGYVNHPGTDPNDFIKRSYNRWWPKAKTYFARISVRAIKDFVKSK